MKPVRILLAIAVVACAVSTSTAWYLDTYISFGGAGGDSGDGFTFTAVASTNLLKYVIGYAWPETWPDDPWCGDCYAMPVGTTIISVVDNNPSDPAENGRVCTCQCIDLQTKAYADSENYYPNNNGYAFGTATASVTTYLEDVDDSFDNYTRLLHMVSVVEDDPNTVPVEPVVSILTTRTDFGSTNNYTTSFSWGGKSYTDGWLYHDSQTEAELSAEDFYFAQYISSGGCVEVHQNANESESQGEAGLAYAVSRKSGPSCPDCVCEE